MSDADLSSMGFTAFGKTPKHHRTAPIHANPTPLPSSLPPRPPQTQQGDQVQQGFHAHNQGQFHRGRGGGRGGGNYRGNFDNRGGRGGGPYRRGFHSNSQQYQRGGRGGRHHHPYPHRQSHSDHHQQERELSTSNTPSYRSKQFGEGLYKPSMNEDPWAPLIQNKQSKGGIPAVAAAAATAAGDVWMGQNASGEEQDKSNWYDKPEDKAADGGGWNADEIDLGDD